MPDVVKNASDYWKYALTQLSRLGLRLFAREIFERGSIPRVGERGEKGLGIVNDGYELSVPRDSHLLRPGLLRGPRSDPGRASRERALDNAPARRKVNMPDSRSAKLEIGGLGPSRVLLLRDELPWDKGKPSNILTQDSYSRVQIPTA